MKIANKTKKFNPIRYIRNNTQHTMVLKGEKNPCCGGVIRPDTKCSYSYDPEVDYFPSVLIVLYNSDLHTSLLINEMSSFLIVYG